MADRLVESILPALTARVHQVMQEQGVPGMAVGIVRGNDLVWSAGFGWADLASERRIDASTRFGVASITKTLTALAIVQLRDLGKLGLDDPVVRHLPEMAAVRNRLGRTEDITLRALLTHHAGLVEVPTGHWSNLRFPSMTEILALLPRVEVVIDPASAFKYCNLAFALLGEVVERVSGRPFVEYARSEILAPLGMSDSGFDIETDRSHTATGYTSDRYQDVPAAAPDPAMNGYTAAAGLRTTVADLARWASLQFRTEAPKRLGAQILAGQSLSEMHRVCYVESDWKTGYALSWFAVRFGENIHHMHPGGVPGYLSLLVFNKLHRFAVVVLSNKQGHSACGAVAFAAAEMLVARLVKETPAPSSPPKPTPDAYRPLVGRYVGELTWGHLHHIEYRRGSLLLVSPSDPYTALTPPPARLIPTDDPWVFLVEGDQFAGEKLTFEVSPDGSVVGFVLGGDVARFHRSH